MVEMPPNCLHLFSWLSTIRILQKQKREDLKMVYKPGQTCPRSGQYAIVLCSTGRDTGEEATVVKGEPFPPTSKPGLCYKLVDPTK